MITKNFVAAVRRSFDLLGIEAYQGIEYDEFEDLAIKKFNRSVSLRDACDLAFATRFCIQNWGKIENLFQNHLNKWQEWVYDKKSSVKSLSDEEACGIYYITNAFERKEKDICLTSISYDDELIACGRRNNKYFLFEDGDYHIKLSALDSRIMKLYSNDDMRLCNIVLSKSWDVFLEKNNSPYELIIDEKDGSTSIAVFEKDYIYSLGRYDHIDYDKMVALIVWDLIDEKSYRAVSQVYLYDDVDEEMIFYFAMAPFLLVRAHNKSEDNKIMANDVLYNLMR